SPFYSHLIRWRNTARTWRFLREGGQNGSPADIDPRFALPAGFESWPALSQAQYLEITSFLSPYLLSSQGDRMAMAHSVEGRYPFLDYRVMEFCNRLPPGLKMPVLVEKWLLKQLGAKYLPDSIWRRRKRPYRAPIHRSFFTPKPADYMGDLLSPAAVADAGLFEPAAVEKLFSKAASLAGGKSGMSEVEDMALVGILSAQLVHRQFIRREGVPEALKAAENLRLIDRLQEPG
ncbi:MAG: asparagine synthase C-terminal domain-containing protein, partial [Anaerolineaceae bacterium]